MSIIPLLALPSGFEMTACSHQEGMLCVSLLSTQPFSRCPLCGTPATRIHSRYQRKLADLPSAGQPVRFLLSVRKFFCDVPTCPRKIFAERLAPFVAPWARVTARLFQLVQIIGLATGDRLGVRVTDRMGIQTSRLTILQCIMALPTAPVGQVIQLGIDDFSFRRGRTFGTILVNMQTHQVIDVRASRKAQTSATWMASHPEIQFVSRDRGGDYASAAATGAPQAVQCADRFHTLKNLGEALEGVLARHLAVHRNHQTEDFSATPLTGAPSKQPPKLSPKAARLTQAKREERLARYQQVVALRKLGLSQMAIADQLRVGHATVSRWLAHEVFPEQQPRGRRTHLDPHLPFLRERWEAGCHTIAQLYRELVARGYIHSYRSMYEQLVRLLPEGRKNSQSPESFPRPPVLARQAVFLFLRRPSDLSSEEQETLAPLRSLHSEVNQAYELVQQFARMLRTRTGEQLDDWLSHVRASQIRELQSFLAGVERDKEAVKAGLTLPTSNDHVA